MQKIVVLGIIEDNKKILVSQRIDPKIKDAHMKWDVPGGKLHSNDHKVNCHQWITTQEALKLDLLPTTRKFIELITL